MSGRKRPSVGAGQGGGGGRWGAAGGGRWPRSTADTWPPVGGASTDLAPVLPLENELSGEGPRELQDTAARGPGSDRGVRGPSPPPGLAAPRRAPHLPRGLGGPGPQSRFPGQGRKTEVWSEPGEAAGLGCPDLSKRGSPTILTASQLPWGPHLPAKNTQQTSCRTLPEPSEQSPPFEGGRGSRCGGAAHTCTQQPSSWAPLAVPSRRPPSPRFHDGDRQPRPGPAAGRTPLGAGVDSGPPARPTAATAGPTRGLGAASRAPAGRDVMPAGSIWLRCSLSRREADKATTSQLGRSADSEQAVSLRARPGRAEVTRGLWTQGWPPKAGVWGDLAQDLPRGRKRPACRPGTDTLHWTPCTQRRRIIVRLKVPRRVGG